MERRTSIALTALAATAAAFLPTAATADPAGPTATRPVAAPNPDFAVQCATTGGGVQQIESWVFVPAPSTDGRTVTATHRTSYSGCSGSAKSTLNQNTPVQWTASCTDPFPASGTETVTYVWDSGDSTTVTYDKVTTTKDAGGNVIRFRTVSTGTVTDGSGIGKAVSRSTLFDPVGSGCDQDRTEVFGTTDRFSIG
ncbi:hypothetical protein [Kitasatospora sp. CB02891]|uniref:hypothetical protein n=1 Tax=Kitasatospora sp. CB02891 TaxID=2020329 RepID=UPI000C276EB1|nr:hypothetical protein [Kitasatospora sp. CB02891]PJN27872.1 hypothetical protein CG736_06615 [Kitasatospora sp. CB02891]